MSDESENVDEEIDSLINEDNESNVNSNKTYPEPFNNPIPEDYEYLGHISAYSTDLKIGREENSIFAIIQPDQRDRVEIGDYIRVPYYRPDKVEDDDEEPVNEQMIASVHSLSYMTNISDRQFTSADTFGAEQYEHVAELKPIAIIKMNENWEEDDEENFISDFVSKPPRPTVCMDKVEEKEFLRCGLEVPSDGIYVGDLSVNGARVPDPDNPLEYYLFNPNATDGNSKDGEPSIFRHVLVAGSTGTGKTHTSKNILRQFAKCKEYWIDVPADDPQSGSINERKRKLNVTIIDPEDEYTQMGEEPRDMNKVEDRVSKRDDVSSGAIGDNTETNFQVFAPNTGDSSTKELKTSTNDVIDFGVPFSIVSRHRELLMPDDPQGPTRQLINTTIKRYFADNDAPYAYDDFCYWFNNTYSEILEESDKFSDSIVSAAARRMVGREEYEAVFDAGSKSLTDDEIVSQMFGAGQVSVITTGHLRGESQNLVIQAISSFIVENKISSDPEKHTIKGTPLVLALDESHEYVNEPQTTREHFIVNKFRRAARRGRKDKFGLYFISQNPADIDGDIRNQINTKIYLQLDRRVVNESDVYVPPEFSNQISRFDKGQMIVVQPDVSPVEVVGLDVCLTRHG